MKSADQNIHNSSFGFEKMLSFNFGPEPYLKKSKKTKRSYTSTEKADKMRMMRFKNERPNSKEKMVFSKWKRSRGWDKSKRGCFSNKDILEFPPKSNKS